MKIFISGKFSEPNPIKAKVIELRKLGHIITHDWTTYQETPGDPDDMKKAAVFDIEGVKQCDLHIVIINDPTYPYRGTFCEMGCSMGLGKSIYLLTTCQNPICTQLPFYYHPNVRHFTHWEDLVKQIA